MPASRPRSLSLPVGDELELPSLTPKVGLGHAGPPPVRAAVLPVAPPPFRARSSSTGIVVAQRSSRKPVALRVFTDPGTAADGGMDDRASVVTTASSASRKSGVSWATKVFDLSFHEAQHAASTVRHLREAIMQLKDPDIQAASGSHTEYQALFKLRDTLSGTDLTDDSVSLVAAGVGLRCVLEVKYPVSRSGVSALSALSTPTLPPAPALASLSALDGLVTTDHCRPSASKENHSHTSASSEELPPDRACLIESGRYWAAWCFASPCVVPGLLCCLSCSCFREVRPYRTRCTGRLA